MLQKLRTISRKKPVKAVLAGFLAAIAGILFHAADTGRDWEQDKGLGWLFQLRGDLKSPSQAVIVTLDLASSKKLGLSNLPRKWPRSLHARLLQQLHKAGARVVTFDMIFSNPRNRDHDRQFSEAIGKIGNVILFEYLHRRFETRGSNRLVIEKLQQPLPILTQNALGTAPFPLPKYPSRVSQAWLFKQGIGDVATMPTLMALWYLRDAYAQLRALILKDLPHAGARLPSIEQIRQHKVPLQEASLELRRFLSNNPSFRLPVKTAGNVRLLFRLYSGPESRFINFYGPPRTVTSLSYHDVLSGRYDAQLKGKAVFVGFSAQWQPEQKDAFYTIYSQTSGLDISGVEIAATVFSNIVNNTPVRPLDAGLVLSILIMWPVLLGLAFMLVAARYLLPVIVIVVAGWLSLSTAAFSSTVWMPMVTPLLVQLPLVLFVVLVWRYADAQRERKTIRQAFGYHLPDKVIDRLSKDMGNVSASTEHVYGICLSTDAQQYTTLSETLEPAELHQFMNRYYETVFAPVEHHGGIISDVVGDAMLAIWARSHPDRELRRQACLAALDILAGVEQFNATEDSGQLPTRIGLHCGDIVMGHVGALGHYEYRAVGDIVNTATRVEGLGKQLGVKLLATGAMVDDLPEFLTCKLGKFRLAGKKEAEDIYQVIGLQEQATEQQLAAVAAFEHIVGLYQQGEWSEFEQSLDAYAENCGKDGPHVFYRALMVNNAQTSGDAHHSGVIEVGK